MSTEYRQFLVDCHHTASQDFDKAIMTLSGGALGLSITFVHDIAPHPSHNVLLGSAWGCFTMSLLLILISFLTSQGALLAMIGAIDDGTALPKKGWARFTAVTNWLSAGGLVAGAVLLVLFALYNL